MKRRWLDPLCASLWEDRLDGSWGSRISVYLIDTLYLFFEDEREHCRKAWFREKINGV